MPHLRGREAVQATSLILLHSAELMAIARPTPKKTGRKNERKKPRQQSPGDCAFAYHMTAVNTDGSAPTQTCFSLGLEDPVRDEWATLT